MVFHVFRDLSSVRAEVTKSVRVVQGACMDLDKNLRGMDANTQSALEDERARRQKVTLQKFLIFPFFYWLGLSLLTCSGIFWLFTIRSSPMILLVCPQILYNLWFFFYFCWAIQSLGDHKLT